MQGSISDTKTQFMSTLNGYYDIKFAFPTLQPIKRKASLLTEK